MITTEHYLRLYSASNMAETERSDKECEMSLSVISEIMCCTSRNSKLTIRKWEQAGWVKWTPGRGRGNKSSLMFLKDPVDLLFDESKKLVKKGKLAAAQSLVDTYSKDFPSLKPGFDRWINSLFGYKAEIRNSIQRDVLRMKVGKQPIYPLDPMLASLRSECHIVKHVCDTLVSYNEETGEFDSGLAFHWEHNRQGDQWTFYIRKGVRFHDGEILTAHDIKSSFNRFLQFNDNPFKWMLDDLQEVVLIDDYCVLLKFKKPNFLVLDILSDEHLSIVHRSEENGVIHDALIGTGPFRLTQNDKSMLVLEANETYFRGRPFLDAVELWNIPDDDRNRSAGTTEVTFGYYTSKKKEVSGRQRQERIEKNVQFLSLNSRKRGALNDPFLRKAIKSIANPSLLVKEMGEFRQKAASSFLQPFERAVTEDVRTLLEKSAYNGEELFLYSFQDRDHMEDAAWLKQKCEKYGIAIKNTFVPAEVLLKKETMETADIIHDSATITEQEELSFLQMVLAENSPLHHHLSSELRGSVIKETANLRGCLDREERMRQLFLLEKELLDSCQVLPLYKNLSELESDESIQQALINSQGWIDFYRIWFKRN